MTQPDDRPIRWGIPATGGIAHAFAHAVLPLDETYTIMQAMDEIRRQIGLSYPPA
jgi:hypothetical protein